MAQPSGLFAQVGANGRFSFGGAVTFIENQVEHLMNHIDPVAEFRGRRRVECDLALREIALGTLQALLDRIFVDEQSAGNLGIAESAKGVQCQGDLIFAS